MGSDGEGQPGNSGRRKKLRAKPTSTVARMASAIPVKKLRSADALQVDLVRVAISLREIRASDHPITSSARRITESGTDILSALAVLRLITSSNRVGCSTGRSPGFAPLRILS